MAEPSLHIDGFDPELKRRAKVHAAAKGISLKEFVTEALTARVALYDREAAADRDVAEAMTAHAAVRAARGA